MNEQLFTGKVQDYEKSRPAVSLNALDYICSLVPNDAVFADIGAGTGKFTSLIANRGYHTYAVEPNQDMHFVLAEKLKNHSNVNIICASAENTGIPSHSVDVVVVVTALHWFDLDAFCAECLRILKPNGFVIAIYNSRKEELRSGIGDSKNNATYVFFDGKHETKQFPNTLFYTQEDFVSYHLSHASAPKSEDPDYKAYLKKIFSDFEENNVNGIYRFDFVSVLYFDKNFINNKLMKTIDN